MIRSKRHTTMTKEWNFGVINIMINFYQLHIYGVITFVGIGI